MEYSDRMNMELVVEKSMYRKIVLMIEALDSVSLLVRYRMMDVLDAM